MEQWAAEAAVCSLRFAEGVSRKSSFSLRVSETAIAYLMFEPITDSPTMS
jgi:hypothetical protein